MLNVDVVFYRAGEVFGSTLENLKLLDSVPISDCLLSTILNSFGAKFY